MKGFYSTRNWCVLMCSDIRALRTFVALILLITLLPAPHASAQLPNSLPQIATPYPGDPRLEPLPSGPINLANFAAFGGGVPLTMHFPPRVNGQDESDGDRHADMWVLFNSATGARVSQPPVLEAVPHGAAGAVSNLTARVFSATWALHAVTVAPTYDPSNLATRIDSSEKIHTSALAINDYQTNIFLNAPVVPNGSTVDPGSVAPMQAFYEGQLVTIVPYDIEDGPLNPQTMFRFVDTQGHVIGAPYLVASHIPTDQFFSSVWEIVSVHAPAGFNVTTLKSEADVQNAHLPVTYAGIRINAPVVAVNGVTVPIENPFMLLTDANGNFNPQKFPFDVAPTTYTKQRTFVITASTPRSGVSAPSTNSFPLIDPNGKGNLILLILVNPLQLQSSAPNSSGPIIRINQADLDAAFQNNNPPQLPSAIEANFTSLISEGLLSSDWAPNGSHTYQERLALIGRALFEIVWRPSQGANAKDVTNCHACHSRPVAGGVGRAQYNKGGLHPGSMWGGGSKELLVSQLKAAGVPGITFAHGSRGQISSLRSDLNSASNTHFGMQSAEFVANATGHPGGYDPTTDLDKDGVANELSVGEITAMTSYLMTLPLPTTASSQALSLLGTNAQSVQNGEMLFRSSIDNGGTACASCHRVFYTMSSNTFLVTNPQTAFALPLQLPFQAADQNDVNDGLAQSVGQMGLHLYGDVKLHKLGSKDKIGGTDVSKTTELWGAGSIFPYLRDGSAGGSLDAAINAHEGVYLSNISVTRGTQTNTTSNGKPVSYQRITITNLSPAPIAATAGAPIRVVLTGPMTPGIAALNSGTAPDGGLRQGAFWLIKQSIPANGATQVLAQFSNPTGAPLQYNLAIQDDAGYSESVASVQAYNALSPSQQEDVDNFMRAQLVADRIGEQ